MFPKNKMIGHKEAITSVRDFKNKIFAVGSGHISDSFIRVCAINKVTFDKIDSLDQKLLSTAHSPPRPYSLNLVERRHIIHGICLTSFNQFFLFALHRDRLLQLGGNNEIIDGKGGMTTKGIVHGMLPFEKKNKFILYGQNLLHTIVLM